MQTALRLQTTVSPEGKIEISAPELSPGKAVEVIILLPETTSSNKLSAMTVLTDASGQRQFKTAQDVSDYLRQEREGWED